jgi:hypothetical protein
MIQINKSFPSDCFGEETCNHFIIWTKIHVFYEEITNVDMSCISRTQSTTTFMKEYCAFIVLKKDVVGQFDPLSHKKNPEADNLRHCVMNTNYLCLC